MYSNGKNVKNYLNFTLDLGFELNTETVDFYKRDYNTWLRL